MKIADLEKKENDESIYQLILEANRINENYILLREVVLKDEAQYCYDSSYASMLIAMLMTMSMTMFMTIVDRSSLGYWIVSKPTLFRISLCFSESYR